MALQTWQAFAAAAPNSADDVPFASLCCKGTGADNNIYVLECNATTGGLPISLTNDCNYGAVGATTLRTASQIGNATGAADFNSGASSAQTLRVVLATRHEASATPLSFRKGNGTNFDDYGTGADGATVPRVTLSTRAETVTTPLAARLSDGTDFIVAEAIAAAQKTFSTVTKAIHTLSTCFGWDGTAHRELSCDTSGNLNVNFSGTMNYGAATSALRVAAQLGNASSVADFGAGAVGAQTLRTTPASDSAHLLATRHEASATPLSFRKGNGTNFDDYGTGADGATVPRVTLSTRAETVTTPLAARLSDGTDFIVAEAIAAAQKTFSTVTKAIHTLSTCFGWDGTAHREIAVDTSGNTKTVGILANATFQTDPRYVYSSLTNAYQTILTAGGNIRAICLRSTVDTEIAVSLDGGITDSVYLTNGDTVSFDLATNGRQIPTGATIQAKYVSAPASGYLRINVFY